jgi:hypothetical protein
MTIVREDENGNNGHHAGGVCRGGRCPSSLATRAGTLALFGRIDRRHFGSIGFGVVGPTRANHPKGWWRETAMKIQRDAT